MMGVNREKWSSAKNRRLNFRFVAGKKGKKNRKRENVVTLFFLSLSFKKLTLEFDSPAAASEEGFFFGKMMM